MKTGGRLLLIPFCLWLSSCNEITRLETEPKTKPRSPYPFSQLITDESGRQIDVKITGKRGDQIAFEKTGTSDSFILPISKLNQENQQQLRKLEDGGKFSSVEHLINQEQRLTNRTAIWHNQLKNAREESSKEKIPILLVALVADDPASEALEKNLMFNKRFRDFANQRLVLCALRVDAPYSQKRTSITAQQNQKILLQYGLSSEGPSLLIFHQGKSFPSIINTYAIDDETTAISEVKKVLNRS